jgi:hypothetical protein
VLNALMPAPYLRREFRVDQPVAAARLYITALGLYEARPPTGCSSRPRRRPGGT